MNLYFFTSNSWQFPWLVLHTATLHTEELDCHTHVSCRGRIQHWHHLCGCKVSTVTTFQNVHPLSDSSSRNKQNRKAYLKPDSCFILFLNYAVHEGKASSHHQQKTPEASTGEVYLPGCMLHLLHCYSCRIPTISS